MRKEDKPMKKISLDNGHSYSSAREAASEIDARNLWNVVYFMMDDATRERVHREDAPDTDIEFLEKYLYYTDDDLVIG